MKFLRCPLLLALALAFASASWGQVPAWPKTTPAEVTAAGIGVQLTGADYGNGVFVLAAYFGGTNAVPAVTPAVFTSSDGTTWTRRTLPLTGARVGHPRFRNGKFFLGIDATTTANGAVLSSADGITWTASTLSTPLYGPSDFAYANGVYVGSVSGISGATYQVITSTDGLAWTPRSVGNGATFVNGITLFQNKFYTADYTAGVLSSSDGVTWAKVTGAPTGPNFAAATSSTLLVLVSGVTQRESLSTDGTTFVTASPGQPLVFQSLPVVNGAFTTVVPISASSSDSTQVTASLDGKTWTTIATAANQYGAADVAYGNGRYVVVGEFDVFAGATTIAAGGTAPTSGGGTTVGTVPKTVAELSAAALAGQSLNFTITGGNSPFESSGDFTLQLDTPSVGRYTIAVSSGNTALHTDTYTYAAKLEGAQLTLNNYIAGQDAINLSLFAAGTPTAIATAGAGKSYWEMNKPGANKHGTFTVGSSSSSDGGTTTAPVIAAQPVSPPSVVLGGSVTFTITVTGDGVTYQWNFNGNAITGAVSASYTIGSVSAANVGSYTVTVTTSGGKTTSAAAVLGVATTAKVVGLGSEIAPNQTHPNGNVYDQVLLQGASASITADANQVTRLSFIDLTDDIVQVELSGAGSLSLVLDNASGPAIATNYNQPAVSYMKGHAGIVVTGANETTNVSIFSVGSVTAVNQALFKSGVTYDGVADLAYLAIVSTNGKFGGVRAANASFYASKGLTGIYAPGVQFTGPVYVGDINAFDAATPTLLLGSSTDVRITGGDLLQNNHVAVKVGGVTKLKFTAGATSHNVSQPVQTNQGVLQDNGTDVTSQLVTYP